MLIINKVSHCSKALRTASRHAQLAPTALNSHLSLLQQQQIGQMSRSLQHIGLSMPVSYGFTSMSNPNQVSLLDQVQAKILQVMKQARPSLFSPPQDPLAAPKTSLKDTPFNELGLDSLDVTEIVIGLEESLGVELTDDQARSIGSIAEANQIFFRKVNARVMNKVLERQEQMNEVSTRGDPVGK